MDKLRLKPIAVSVVLLTSFTLWSGRDIDGASAAKNKYLSRAATVIEGFRGQHSFGRAGHGSSRKPKKRTIGKRWGLRSKVPSLVLMGLITSFVALSGCSTHSPAVSTHPQAVKASSGSSLNRYAKNLDHKTGRQAASPGSGTHSSEPKLTPEQKKNPLVWLERTQKTLRELAGKLQYAGDPTDLLWDTGEVKGLLRELISMQETHWLTGKLVVGSELDAKLKRTIEYVQNALDIHGYKYKE